MIDGMVKPASTDKILAATGMAFAEWATLLDAEGARALSHKQIADLIFATGNSSGWWAQTITVAYEQHIGRRLPGQRADGRFSASILRALPVSAAEAFVAWRALIADETDIAGLKCKGEPTTSETASGLNWRCRTEDGSWATGNFLDAAPNKCRASVGHEGLAEAGYVALVKDYWGGKLEGLRNQF